MAYDDLAPKYVLQVEGSELGSGITQFVDQVEYESADGMADMARITVTDPGGMLGDLKVFKPGGELDIWMGYGPNVSHVGRVILRRHRHSFPPDGDPSFQVEGYTLDALMMDNSPEEGKKRRFPDLKFSEIVTEVALNYGFGELDIDETPDRPKRGRGRWQKAGITDYQVVQGLANITGFYFWVDYLPDAGGWTLHFKDPAKVLESVDQPNHVFRYNDGDNSTLLQFYPELLIQGATTKLKVVFKNPKNGKRVVEEIEEENDSPDIAFTGNEQEITEEETGKPTEIKVFLGEYSFDLQPKRFSTSAEALQWARQWFRRNKENFILGEGMTIGAERLRARQFHTLENLTNTFSGKYYFSKVRHVLSASDGYMCTFNARKQESLT
jgi:phage protein D